MKTIKYLFLLMITIGIAALIYFNQNYFLATTTLSLNFKDTVYSIPELPTVAYLGICFLFGLLLSGINTLSTKLCMGKTIKEKESLIATLSSQIDDLKNELNFFKNDPYIKKGAAQKALEAPAEDAQLSEEAVPETQSNEPVDEEDILETEKPEALDVSEPQAVESTDSDNDQAISESTTEDADNTKEDKPLVL